MTTPLSDEQLAEIRAHQADHHVVHQTVQLDRLAAFVLAADADELIAEVDRLRAENDRLQSYADRLADRAGENYQRAQRAEKRSATLHDLLERVQWGNTGACPECGRMWLPGNTAGHAPDCALDAALNSSQEETLK